MQPPTSSTLVTTCTHHVKAETQAWVEHAVLFLNLCPFAKTPWTQGQVRLVVSEATQIAQLLTHLESELNLLAEADPKNIETTLLVHPHVLNDFLEFNDFLEAVDQLLDSIHLTGVIQVASFHPHYQFAGTDVNDVSNATNRSPYPTLHLLREASVEWAVDSLGEKPETVFEANMATLERLGTAGWSALQAQCQAKAREMLGSTSPQPPNEPLANHAPVQRD